jgi:hypothetical protein
MKNRARVRCGFCHRIAGQKERRLRADIVDNALIKLARIRLWCAFMSPALQFVVWVV